SSGRRGPGALGRDRRSWFDPCGFGGGAGTLDAGVVSELNVRRFNLFGGHLCAKLLTTDVLQRLDQLRIGPRCGDEGADRVRVAAGDVIQIMRPSAFSYFAKTSRLQLGYHANRFAIFQRGAFIPW